MLEKLQGEKYLERIPGGLQIPRLVELSTFDFENRIKRDYKGFVDFLPEYTHIPGLNEDRRKEFSNSAATLSVFVTFE